MRWNGWSAWWLFWIAQFGVAEGYALATNYRNTFSEQVWALEGKNGTIIQFVVGAITFWLFLHLTFHLYHALR